MWWLWCTCSQVYWKCLSILRCHSAENDFKELSCFVTISNGIQWIAKMFRYTGAQTMRIDDKIWCCRILWLFNEFQQIIMMLARMWLFWKEEKKQPFFFCVVTQKWLSAFSGWSLSDDFVLRVILIAHSKKNTHLYFGRSTYVHVPHHHTCNIVYVIIIFELYMFYRRT